MANEKNEKKEVAKKKAKGPGLFALTVLAFIVLMSIVIGVLDFVFGKGLSLLGTL